MLAFNLLYSDSDVLFIYAEEFMEAQDLRSSSSGYQRQITSTVKEISTKLFRNTVKSFTQVPTSDNLLQSSSRVSFVMSKIFYDDSNSMSSIFSFNKQVASSAKAYWYSGQKVSAKAIMVRFIYFQTFIFQLLYFEQNL